MFVSKWPRHLLCLSLSLPLGTALACGPDFPMRLLDNRGATLGQLPETEFGNEITRLGQRIPGLKDASALTYNPDESYYAAPTDQAARDKAEQLGLTPPQQALVGRLRQLSDAREVEAQGAGLPYELSFYTAGAVAFAAGDHELAATYLRKVLALPSELRPLRSTWAAYSLGRALYALSLDDSEPLHRAQLRSQAIQAFEQARQMSIEGLSDPLELGVASLGEQARVAKASGDWNGAIGLYAAQNLHGSAVGYSSLKQVASELRALPSEQLAQQLQGKPVQTLLTASLISRLGWSFGDQPSGEKNLIKLLQNSTQGSLENADRLAALNYQQGDYAQTQAFLEHAGDSGLAWWLRAKLALRAGDKSAAASAYAQAAKAFPQEESWGLQRGPDGDLESLQPRCRVEGESAILALERGDYLQAFEQLYRSQDVYWFDAATVAERVLTLDELKQYVDAQVPAPPQLSDEDRANYVPLPVAARLRNLLGRRMMREGRFDEALAYFADPEVRGAAQGYGELRREAESSWLPGSRAPAYYWAGTLARDHGMEFLGYEMAPDFASLDGGFSLGGDALVAGDFVSAGEVQRHQASAAQPDERYHYRWVAADLANRAADFLPHTSQAFAAVLCHAATWTRGSEQEKTYYRRYVAQGPYVWWAENFGSQCQAPDFSGINQRYVTQAVGEVRAQLRPYKTWVTYGGVGVFVAAGLWLITRRRKA